jgi:hypothetical protein
MARGSPVSIIEVGVNEPGVGDWQVEELVHDGGRRAELPLRVDGAAVVWIRAYATPSEPRAVKEVILWFRDHTQAPTERHECRVAPPLT